jgi:uncharacterized protein with GYD domain
MIIARNTNLNRKQSLYDFLNNANADDELHQARVNIRVRMLGLGLDSESYGQGWG